MLLSGSIRKFDLASVLQFLAQEHATGIVEVRDFDEFGFIYLIEGRVQAISLPMTDEKLGTRLLRAGLLDRAAALRGAHGRHAAEQGRKEGQAPRPAPARQGLHHRRPGPRHHGQADPRPDLRSRPLAERRVRVRRVRQDARVHHPHRRQRPGAAARRLPADRRGRGHEDQQDGGRQRGVLRLSRRERVQRRHQREATSSPTSACGGAWGRSSTTTTNACRTPRSSTSRAPQTRSRRSRRRSAPTASSTSIHEARRPQARGSRLRASRSGLGAACLRPLPLRPDRRHPRRYLRHRRRAPDRLLERGRRAHHRLLGRRRRRQSLLRRHPGPRGRLRPQALHRLVPARRVHRRRAPAQRERGLPQARRRRTSRRVRQDPALRDRRQPSTASRSSASSRRWPDAR